MTSQIRTMITSDAAKEQIAAALPSHMTADRQVRVLLTALNKTPKLEKCTQASLIAAMMTCSELGLEPNGRDAHLIPYGTTATLVVDYKGLVELAYRSERVTNIETGVVHEGDLFDYETCRHVPWHWRTDAGPPAGLGKVIGAFCIVEMKGGAVHRERMTYDEIEDIRKSAKAGSGGPWVTHWGEMARKTVFRRASKWIPKSAHLARALEANDDAEGMVTQAKSDSIDAESFSRLMQGEGRPEDTGEAEEAKIDA